MLDSTASVGGPNTWWWLMGDGCDLVSGLKESVKLEWSGDVDVNTGELQQSYRDYTDLLSFASSVGRTKGSQIPDLNKCSTCLTSKKDFLVKAKTVYSVVASGSCVVFVGKGLGTFDYMC